MRAELRRSGFRAATVAVALLLGGLPGAALIGLPTGDPRVALLALGPALVVAALSWLEARALIKGGAPDLELALLGLLAPPLVALAILQGAWVLAAMHSSSVQGGLADWAGFVRDAAPTGEFALGVVSLAVPLVAASWRRVRLFPLPRAALWGLLLSVVTFSYLLPAFVLWLLVEALYGVSDALQTIFQRGRDLWRRSPEAEALRGLPFGRLWLMAWADHAPARELLGPRAPVLPPDLPTWLRGVEGGGAAAVRRAALATARRVVPDWQPPPGWQAAREALAAWTREPTTLLALQAGEALLQAPLPPPDPRARALRELGRAIGPDELGRGAALARALPGLGDPREVRDEVAGELLDLAQRGEASPGAPAPAAPAPA